MRSNIMSYKHILVAVDLSKSSEQVIQKAVSLAKGAGAKLSLIYVDGNYVSDIANISSSGLTKLTFDKAAILEKEKKLLQEELQKLVEDIDYPIAKSLVVMGDFKDQLTTTINEIDVDLLICGHHHDFWSRLLSSVRKLVNSVTVDFLIVYLDD